MGDCGRLRIGVVQFTPKLGDVAANIANARSLIASIKPDSLDLLCFPEMAFSGYVFPDAASILPHLEDPVNGPTGSFCAETARALRCYVAAGLPTPLHSSETRETRAGDVEYVDDAADFYGRGKYREQVGANTAILCDPLGTVCTTYRKSNLYREDVPWAKPGEGFTTIDLPPPLGRTSFGICMDLNPRSDAVDPMNTYELADHCARMNVRTLILLNAWLFSEANTEHGEHPTEPKDEHIEDWSTVKYWAYRLYPLYAKLENDGVSTPEETYVVVCNRTGIEKGITFAGSSALFRCQRGLGHAQLIDAMGWCEQGIRMWIV